MSQKEKSRFLMKNIQSCLNFTSWNPVFTFPLRIILKPKRLSSKKITITTRAVSELESLEERRKWRLTFQMKDTIFHSLVWTLDIFMEVGKEFGVVLGR